MTAGTFCKNANLAVVDVIGVAVDVIGIAVDVIGIAVDVAGIVVDVDAPFVMLFVFEKGFRQFCDLNVAKSIRACFCLSLLASLTSLASLKSRYCWCRRCCCCSV